MNPRFLALRPLVPVLAAALLLQACASTTDLLAKEELVSPPPAQLYRVTKVDGSVHNFISLHLERDVLYGTERITTEVPEGEGEAVRTTAWNRYEEQQIPWSDVQSVEADSGKKKNTGLFLAIGAIAVGIGAFLLLSGSEDPPPTTGGGGKDF